MKMSRYPSTSPWWLRVALPLALALWVAPVAQAQTADRLEGQIPEEVEAFRATAERFDLRMAEVDADTRDFVALREEEERVCGGGGCRRHRKRAAHRVDEGRALKIVPRRLLARLLAHDRHEPPAWSQHGHGLVPLSIPEKNPLTATTHRRRDSPA